MRKKLSAFFSLLLLAGFAVAQNTPHDECFTASNLGQLSLGSQTFVPVNTTGATISTNTSSNCIGSAADVWYKFTVPGNQLSLAIAADSFRSMELPLVSIYSGNSCSALTPLTCFGLSTTAVTLNISPAATYYLQIGGLDQYDDGAFTLSLLSDSNNAFCVLSNTLAVDPVPVRSQYQAGQTVTFTFTVTDYNKNALNWIHGIIPTFGPGWDISTFSPVSIPYTCAAVADAHWGFYNSDSGYASGLTFGPGFYYETSSGSTNGTIDNDPGNNYGDAGVGPACPLVFSWQIRTRADGSCTNNADLSVKIKTSGDSESGSWTSPACESDTAAAFRATLSCCLSPLMYAVKAGCSLSNGQAVAVGQGTGPWSYRWTNSLDATVIEHNDLTAPDTLKDLAPGQYFVTTYTNTSCAASSAITVSADAGTTPSVTVHPDADTICAGSPVVFNADITLAGTAPSFQWKKNNTNVGNNSLTYTDSGITSNDSVWVVMASNASCASPAVAVSSSVKIVVQPTPAAPVATSNSPVKKGNTITLSANNISGAIYRWTGPNLYAALGKTQSILNATAAMGGIYQVVAEVKGCSSQPGSVLVIVDDSMNVSGRVRDEFSTGVLGADVLFTGSFTGSAITTTNGSYSFKLPAGSTDTITPVKNNDIVTNNGVTLADYLSVQRYVNSGANIIGAPYKLIAADVNSNNVIDTTDASLILQMSLNNISSFPGDRLWAFVPTSYYFNNPKNPFPFPRYAVVKPSGVTNHNFTAIKLGDVNNTWNPFIRAGADSAKLSLPQLDAARNIDISIPVKVKGMNAVSGFQFTLQWDASVMDYKSVSTTTGLKLISSTEPGMLRVLSYATDYAPFSLPDNSNAFTVTFHTIGNAGDVTQLSISSDSTAATPVQVLDSALLPLPLGLTAGQVRIDNTVAINDANIQTGTISVSILPNPFGTYTNLVVETAKAEEAELRIINELGQEVKNTRTKLDKGQNRITIAENLSAGNYFLQITTKDFSKTFKLVCLGR